MSVKARWKSFLLHKEAHWTVAPASAPCTSATPLLRIAWYQLGHDESMQAVNPLRACESASRKVLGRVRTFCSLISRCLRNQLQGKDKLRINKTFGNTKNWIIILRQFPGEKDRGPLLQISTSDLSSWSEFSPSRFQRSSALRGLVLMQNWDIEYFLEI